MLSESDVCNQTVGFCLNLSVDQIETNKMLPILK